MLSDGRRCLMSERSAKAEAMFRSGFNCAQAVFANYADLFGMDRETALRVAGAMGGGVGRSGGPCGALCGALLLVGMKSGQVRDGDKESKARCYAVAKDVIDRFRGSLGKIDCRDILGCDMGTPEGRAMAKEKGLLTTICPRAVVEACGIAEEVLVL